MSETCLSVSQGCTAAYAFISYSRFDQIDDLRSHSAHIGETCMHRDRKTVALKHKVLATFYAKLEVSKNLHLKWDLNH